MGGEQQEMGNLPPKGKVHEKAVEYLAARKALDAAKNTSDGLKKELVQLMIDDKKSQVRVDGKVVSYSHTDTDKLTVKNAE